MNIPKFGELLPPNGPHRVFNQPSAIFVWRAGRRSSQLNMSNV